VLSVARSALRLLVLGDSIASGTGARHPGDTLGRRLAAALTADGFDVDLHVRAVPGAVSADLPRQARTSADVGADLALVVIGANDLTRLVPPERAAASLDEALRILRASRPPGPAGTRPRPDQRGRPASSWARCRPLRPATWSSWVRQEKPSASTTAPGGSSSTAGRSCWPAMATDTSW